MTQASYILDADQTGQDYSTDLQAVLQAVNSMNAGTTEPTETYAYMLWADTTNNLIKIRNAANSGWQILAPYNKPLLSRDMSQIFPTVGGTGDAITCTFSSLPFTSYTAGMTLMLKIANANTGAVTISVDGMAAKQLRKDGAVAMAAGDLVAGQLIQVVYDGTQFMMASPVQGLSRALIATGATQAFHLAAAPSGWLELNGSTIGDASSGAAYASPDAELLFKAIWFDTTLTVSGSRGANAAADWLAHKTITLPNYRERTVIGSGSVAGLTTRVTGQTGGEEAHALTSDENGPHTHSLPNGIWCFDSAYGGYNYGGGSRVLNITSAGVTTGSSGSGTPHNNMQPFIAALYCIKL